MGDEVAKVLQTSDQPEELVAGAVQLAGSDRRDDHELLLRSLGSRGFLLRLNTQEEYEDIPQTLHLSTILDELSDNRAESARETIVALTRNRAFTKEPACTDLLIEATVVVRPAPPDLIEFWDAHCQPEDTHTPLTIEAIIENESQSALELFERKMAGPEFEDDDKIDWMRSSVLTHRNSAPLLECCERLLLHGLSGSLRSELVDVLFDYKPEEWFPPAVSRIPPATSAYTASARAAVHRLGELVLHSVTLTRRQREAIEKMLEL